MLEPAMDTIWVGEIEGKALVYDPTIQLPDCPHLFLWRPSDGEMGKYIADLTRKRIKPYSDRSKSSTYVADYQVWRNSYGAAWLAEEKCYYESRKAREAEQEKERLEREIRKGEAERNASLALEERHKERLKRLGKEYRGVRPASENLSRHRVTHCHNCKDVLDNSIDIECGSCGWILCRCGACGRGYRS